MEQTILGKFDGQNMKDEKGKVYPVPPNYASKSKLLEGDELKLIITPDGSFLYKQIGPVKRFKVRAVVVGNTSNNDLDALAGTTVYKLLQASVRYYKLQIGDEISISVPNKGTWGVIENVMPKAHSSEEEM